MSSQLPCIESDQLAAVTGGTSKSDDQLTTALTTIQKSLKDLGAARNTSRTSVGQLVPLVVMAKIARREL